VQRTRITQTRQRTVRLTVAGPSNGNKSPDTGNPAPPTLTRRLPGLGRSIIKLLAAGVLSIALMATTVFAWPANYTFSGATGLAAAESSPGDDGR
jgi:hypothetical protein